LQLFVLAAQNTSQSRVDVIAIKTVELKKRQISQITLAPVCRDFCLQCLLGKQGA